MAVFIAGLIGTIVFYIVILVIGLIAGRKKSTSSDSQFLANRDLGLFVSSFTLSATMVGGAYISGTASEIATRGLVNTVAPIGYNIGIAIAGVVFAPKVRRGNYTTIFDLFQIKFGKRMGAVLFFNELFANIFWEAAILGALGASLKSIIGLDMNVAVISSACVAVVYTFFGGLYSVAYTDVIQLIFIGVGLTIALPFVFTNDSVDLSRVEGKWLGTVPIEHIGNYIDTFAVVVFGGIPWQSYYQRVLACNSPSLARNATLVSIIYSMLLFLPPAFLGLAGASADWNSTSYEGNLPLSGTDWESILPMVLQHLCPTAVAVIALGALSAAVMSSADSIILAVGSVVARNIYQNILRPNASDREVVWVFRICVVIVGILGTVFALTVQSVYGLLILCGDLMAVSQFPQLICALWLEVGNTYGSLVGLIVGLLLRVLGGEQVLGIDAVIKYPFYDVKHNQQKFPFKVVAMLCSLGAIILTSYVTHFLFTRHYLSKKFDIFRCFPVIEKEIGIEHENDLMLQNKNKNSYPNLENSDEKATLTTDQKCN
ncbi:high-affinity choline transporter 1-like isoform X1 [Saccostrea cucullata]|uniref:high-affinity choline transporter 1-like isoform X1 n=1 Tax=Saccostrea cuccullata TaxID=36930 RepID=UPI002ED1DC18